MKKLINTKGTEFEQNGKDLAIIDTEQRGGIPIMLDSADLDAGIINGDSDALDKISVDVDNEPEVEVTPTTEDQTVIPGEEYTGLSKVTVNAVTSDVDENITPKNILKGVSILGVTGEAQTDAYVKKEVAGSGYNTDANKLTVKKIVEELDKGNHPLVYIYSRYNGGGSYSASDANKYYICNIDRSNANGLSFKAYIGVALNGAVVKNDIPYYPDEWVWVWCPISEGEVGTITTGVTTNYNMKLQSWTDGQPVAYNNTTPFTPSGDYNLANKKYVDDSIAAIPQPDLSAYETYAKNFGRFPVFNWGPNIVLNGQATALGTSDLRNIQGFVQEAYNNGRADFAIYCALKDDSGTGNYYKPHRFLLLQRETTAIYAKPKSIQFAGFNTYDQSLINSAIAHVALNVSLSWSGDTVTATSGTMYSYRRDFVTTNALASYASKEYVDTAIDAVDGYDGVIDIGTLATTTTGSSTGINNDTFKAAMSTMVTNWYAKGVVTPKVAVTGNFYNTVLRSIVNAQYIGNSIQTKPTEITFYAIYRKPSNNNVQASMSLKSDTITVRGSWNGDTFTATYAFIYYDCADSAYIVNGSSSAQTVTTQLNFQANKTPRILGTPTEDTHVANKKYVDDALAGASGGIPIIQTAASGMNLSSDANGSLENSDVQAIEDVATQMNLQIGEVKPVIMEVDSRYIFGSITRTPDSRVTFGGIVTRPDNALTSLFKAYTREYSGILKAQWSNKVLANNSQVSAFEDLLATPVDISGDFEIDSSLSYASELSIRSLGNSWRRDETGEFNINVVIENTGSTDRSGLTLFADWSFGDDPEFIESDSQVLIKTLPTIKAGEQLILTGLYKANDWQLFMPEANTAVRVGLRNE